MQTETRRSFLTMSMGGVAALGTGAVGYGAYRLLARPPAQPTAIDFSDVTPGTFADITASDRKAVVFRDQDGAFHAYMLTCPHAGCAVTLQNDQWVCTCDGSTFALNGEALTGPAIQPLHRVTVRFDGPTMLVPPAIGKVIRS